LKSAFHTFEKITTMRKSILTLTISLALITACKKEEPAPPAPAPDTTSPVLTLKGKASDTVSLKSTYTDAGATAIDDVDGDISPQISVTGTVNTNRVGGNYLYYSVKDAAGNTSQTTRYVFVRNDAYRLVGNYSVVSNCGAGFTGLNSTAWVETSITNNNLFSLSSQQFQTPGFGVLVVVNGTLLTMNTQPVASSLASGTGTLSADLKSFTLVTTYTPAIQGSAGCNIVYTRQ
jgi:hypothetical protein